MKKWLNDRVRLYLMLIIIMLFCCIYLCGWVNGNNNVFSSNDNKKYKDKDDSVEEWYREILLRNTGSAKYLDGNTVLVSIFWNDSGSIWTEQEKKNALQNTGIAVDYLKKQGKKYNREVNLIYDFESDSDLLYTYESTLDLNEGWIDDINIKNDAWQRINKYLENDVDSLGIMKKYNTDSIGYLVFLDKNMSSCNTFPFHYAKGVNRNREICFISMRWKSGEEVEPTTYAHEILHLFGARDLYTTNESDGTNRAFVDYMAKNYPKDIMLGYSSKTILWPKKISARITDVTAYYLGWKNKYLGCEKFPMAAAETPGTFVYREVPNFEIYRYPSRVIYPKVILWDCIFIIIIIIDIIANIILKRKRSRVNKINTYNKYVDYGDFSDFSNFNNSNDSNGFL